MSEDKKEYVPAMCRQEAVKFDLGKEDRALDKQIGGGHYKEFAIQPIEFTMKNNLNFCQGNIIKYVCRYKDKNGKQDLLKAKHYIDLLIELEFDNVEGKKAE